MSVKEVLGIGQKVYLHNTSGISTIEVDTLAPTHTVLNTHDSYVLLEDLKTGATTYLFNFDIVYLAPNYSENYHFNTYKVRLDLLEISSRAFEEYCRDVNDNQDVTMDVARRKLTRNVICAKKLHQRELDKEKNNTGYQYGNMFIVVSEKKTGKVVTRITNHKKNDLVDSRYKKQYRNWSLDQRLYSELSAALGIPSKHNKYQSKSVVEEDKVEENGFVHRVFNFFKK
ncbi:hypothetical protein [Priestia flexa]|uniref:hypothetical protein n=1 Tax=Priestia flexa TaxID=86664 RepID=UPI00047390FD|nr:hypothetical protein [Priestia flexa]